MNIGNVWNSIVDTVGNFLSVPDSAKRALMVGDLVSEQSVTGLMNLIRSKMNRLTTQEQNKIEAALDRLANLAPAIGSPGLNSYIQQTRNELMADIEKRRKDITNYENLNNSFQTVAEDFKNQAMSDRTREDMKTINRMADNIDRIYNNNYEEKMNE